MASSHHGERRPDSRDFENHLMRRFAEQEEGTANRQWPEGRISGDDDGELAFVVAAKDGLVRLDFGKPVEWMAMPPEQAVQMAQLLIKQARSVATKPLRISIN